MDPHPTTLSDCYAAERTFLAWVRTSLAIMGFGFVVARFAAAGTQVIAGYFGAALVLIGSFANLVSTIEYARRVRCFRAAGFRHPAALLGIGIAATLILAGLLMAAYLVLFIA